MTVVGRKRSQTTTALPVCHKKRSHPLWLRLRVGAAAYPISEPPYNIKAFWEISQSGPKALFMDRHTHVSLRALLRVNARLQPRKSMSFHTSVNTLSLCACTSLCMHVKFRREGDVCSAQQLQMLEHLCSCSAGDQSKYTAVWPLAHKKTSGKCIRGSIGWHCLDITSPSTLFMVTLVTRH